MLKKAIAVTAGLAVTGLVTLMPVSAQAATGWPDPITVGDYVFESTSNLDFYGTGATGFDTMYNDTGILVFDDGLGGSITSESFCADPIDPPGGVTTEGGDTIITCAPYVIPNGSPGEGLTVTVEIRILSGIPAQRILYKVENTTGSAVDVPSAFIWVEWEYDTSYGLTSSGVRGTGATEEMAFGAHDKWIEAAENNGFAPSALVWASCQAEVDVVGDDASHMEISNGGSTTFAPGSTTYYVAFQEMKKPTAQTDEAMNAAIDAFGPELAARYAYLSPELRVGIPEGATVEFWDDACAPAPELPDTGSSASELTGMGVLAASVLGLGVLALVRSRRARG